MSEIQHVIAISSDIHTGCQECNEWKNPSEFSGSAAAEKANHYVQAHGYRILHIGQETGTDNEGRPHQNTVIIVGTTDRSNVDRVAAEREKGREEFRRKYSRTETS